MMDIWLQTSVKTLADTLQLDVIGFETLDHAPKNMLIPEPVAQTWNKLDANGRLAVIYMALKLHQVIRSG